MVRRTTGFVSKRPHRKSRGGCTTCKRKKVKCDELLPSCSYCALRKLDCIYPEEKKNTPDTSVSSNSPQHDYEAPTISDEEFLQTPSWLVPAAHTSSGQLTPMDLELLHQYKHTTWKTLSVRNEAIITTINLDWVPRVALSHSYLLNAILSITAAHRNTLYASPQAQDAALLYRQKAFNVYNQALQDITTHNYETLLITSLFMQMLVPPPELPCTDDAMLDWLSTFIAMTQGLRIMASLKWARGIEKLSIFPIFRRELKTLPPPPMIEIGGVQDPGESEAANPEATQKGHGRTTVSTGIDMTDLPFRPQTLMGAKTHSHHPVPASWKPAHTWELPAPAFLPPPLTHLLLSLIRTPDPDCATLLPALHALSPIFLSLYYFRLCPDVYVRIIVLPTFLTPEFLDLVRRREPRALVVMAWWFAFVVLVPDMWWVGGSVPRLVQAASNAVMRSEGGGEKKMLMDAVEGAFRVVRLVGARGREVAARSIFEGWEGVDWDVAGGISDY